MTPPTPPTPEACPSARAVRALPSVRRRLLACALSVLPTVPVLLAWPAAGSAQAPAQVAAQELPYAPERALAGALSRYRVLAGGPDLRPPEPSGVVRPGAAYPDAPLLRRYLAALGDLAPPEASPLPAGADTTLSPELVQGVVAFQERHGLTADGIIGPATVLQMRVPLAQRVRQLELALERWRQLPDTLAERTIVVNVPGFRMYAFDRDPYTARPLLRMNVIVGRAEGRHATPLFSGTMREVVFQPYWDVPLSIARSELLPKIRRDAGYMARQELEIVRGGDRGATIFPPTGANLARVASGELRLRQRPGPVNSLGGVKFLFPNRHNVYLHGTPENALFGRARRDFSHGCIRLEDPASLAEWVLQGQGGWNRDSVVAAMTTGGISRRVQVARPVAVHILYATAVVGDDGLVRFYPDIYGHDAARASGGTVPGAGAP